MNGLPIRALACALLAIALATAEPQAAPASSIAGTPRSDRLVGTARSDVVLARGGHDRVRTLGGNDRVFAGRGNDRVSGGPGRDKLVGGPGRDRLFGGAGNDLLIAGGGRDRVSCGPGRDRALLDSHDVIVDATEARPDGSCEAVKRTGQSAQDARLIAAGDIADCTGGATVTAALLDKLPGTVATLGDNAYQRGTPDEFARCYAPTWGRHKGRTRPAVGNHEYGTPGASGYFGYFGAAAGDPAQGWYSYELGAWHVVALNSNCGEVGGCGSGSPQERWLRADLAAHPAMCTLAYWHHPRFSSGNAHGDNSTVAPLWGALRDFGAELVLSGHDHDYERFAPQSAEGAADPAGIREFVVGTGGAHLRQFASQPQPNSEVRIAGIWGVLALRLEPRAYEWEFVPQPGSTARDSGHQACH